MEATGYIIRVTPYQEANAIVNLLTANGLVTFSARGILKINAKNASAIQPFHYVKVDLAEGKMATARYSLKTAELLCGVEKIINNLTAMSALFTIGEIVNKLFVNDEEISEIYPYFAAAIKTILNGFDPFTAILLFLAASLKVAGYGLEVNQCVNCGSKKNIKGFSVEEGGLLCETCLLEQGGKSLSPRMINIVRYIFLFPAEKFAHTSFAESENSLLISQLLIYLNDMLNVKINSYNDFLKVSKV